LGYRNLNFLAVKKRKDKTKKNQRKSKEKAKKKQRKSKEKAKKKTKKFF
jgi:hypothetical protein